MPVFNLKHQSSDALILKISFQSPKLVDRTLVDESFLYTVNTIRVRIGFEMREKTECQNEGILGTVK
jgi:hypothetical protein